MHGGWWWTKFWSMKVLTSCSLSRDLSIGFSRSRQISTCLCRNLGEIFSRPMLTTMLSMLSTKQFPVALCRALPQMNDLPASSRSSHWLTDDSYRQEKTCVREWAFLCVTECKSATRLSDSDSITCVAVRQWQINLCVIMVDPLSNWIFCQIIPLKRHWWGN